MAATTAVTEASTVAVLANANAIDSVSVARLSEAEEIMIVGAALYKQLHLRSPCPSHGLAKEVGCRWHPHGRGGSVVAEVPGAGSEGGPAD